MEGISRTFKMLQKSIQPNITKKSRKVRFKHNSRSHPSSKSKTRSRKSHSSASPVSKLRKNISKYQKSIVDVDSMIKNVDTLNLSTKSMFKKKTKQSPDSPIILTVKNLDTGKTKKATVLKNLNTGKYQLQSLSNSK